MPLRLVSEVNGLDVWFISSSNIDQNYLDDSKVHEISMQIYGDSTVWSSIEYEPLIHRI